MKVDFERLHWENYPSESTPIDADNLNRLEEGVAGLYSDVADLENDLTAMSTATASDASKALSPKTVTDGKVTEWQFKSISGGTSDYTDLDNKPQINSVTLTGNKSLSDIGAIAAPSSPAIGAFLAWDGSAWVAQTLSTWQGGSY